MFESLAAFGGSLASVQRVAYFVPDSPPERKRELELLGVETREVDPPHRGSPWANKLAALEDPTDYDWLALIDTDALVVGDFGEFFKGDVLRACSVHAPDAPTFGQWRALFAMFDLEFPEKRLRASVTGELTPPALATGIMLIPAPVVDTLRDAWGGVIDSMVARRDEILDVTGFQWGGGDQIPLTLALQKGGIAFQLLPIGMLFPTNERFPDKRGADEVDPLIIHPSRRRTRYGSIGPSGYRVADARIATVNRTLGLGPTRLDHRVGNAINSYRLAGKPAFLHPILQRIR
jgi:hypothetical protein